MEIIEKLKKVDFRDRKYIFPLILFVPLSAMAYFIPGIFTPGDRQGKAVMTDSINATMPAADNGDMKDRYDEMQEGMAEGGYYTAVDGIGQEEAGKDSSQVYSEGEMDAIDRKNAEQKQRQQEENELRQKLSESSRHVNSYDSEDDYSSGAYKSSRKQEMDQFARDLEDIQRRSGSYSGNGYSSQESPAAGRKASGSGSPGGSATGRNGNAAATAKEKKDRQPDLVSRIPDRTADSFNTIGNEAKVDKTLIRAMIDKTTRAHEGTRLRFKLLDDVTVKGMKLPKGTYLYGIVSGFGQQRVMADISSILVRDQFVKVHLSVYDLDGMEGFYVPESAFRDMMKNAGSSALQNNLSLNNGNDSEVNAESIALQTLQNMYSSASSAVSADIRKNKARIKYNTVVYLINTDAADDQDNK
jgi:conjugative transposon TraM protein